MDLTKYSDNELSLVVFNDYGLYTNRYTLTKELLNELGYRFTNEQWRVFREDLESEE